MTFLEPILWPFFWTLLLLFDFVWLLTNCTVVSIRTGTVYNAKDCNFRTWCVAQALISAGSLCPCWSVCLGERWGLDYWSLSFWGLHLLFSCKEKLLQGKTKPTGEVVTFLKNKCFYVYCAGTPHTTLLLAPRFPSAVLPSYFSLLGPLELDVINSSLLACFTQTNWLSWSFVF